MKDIAGRHRTRRQRHFFPVAALLSGKVELAFDHLRILRDAIERVRVELEISGIATAFVGHTFTLAELRAVYEAVWDVQLDAANFRRSIVAEEGWVVPTGRRAKPGSTGGRPAELYRPGKAWSHGGPIHRTQRDGGNVDHEAVVADTYGSPDVLRIEDVPLPVPGEGEVRVRVVASSVTRSDCGFRSASPFFSRAFTGLRRPKRRIVGTEFAGVVDAVGPGVKEFAPGDEVFGFQGGANAEFVCVPEHSAIAHKPVSISFEEAGAATDGASISRACLKKVDLREGKRILVYGATGAIGTAAVQLAKATGAHVTAVGNTKNLELVRSLGADEVIDYLQEDFTQNGQTYDVIFDAVGKHSFRRCRGSLNEGGTFLETDLGFMWHVPFLILGTRWIGDKKVILPIPVYSKDDVLHVKELIEAGTYRTVIDRTVPLEDVVEATRYVETGEKTGNVVLTVGSVA